MIPVRNNTSPSTSVPREWPVASSLVISATSQLALMGGALITIAAVVRSVLPLRWHFVVAALGCYGVVGALVFTRLPRHAPHRCMGFANSVTLTRGLITALLWGIIAELLVGNVLVLDSGVRWLVVLAATAALLSDGLDGWVARRSGTASSFGAHLDMEVDALFLLALSLLVYATREVGTWVIASGTLRYAFVLFSYAWPRLAMPLLPRWRRKVICVVQISVLIAALVPVAPIWATQTLCFGGLALLCYSFAVDLIWLASKS